MTDDESDDEASNMSALLVVATFAVANQNGASIDNRRFHPTRTRQARRGRSTTTTRFQRSTHDT